MKYLRLFIPVVAIICSYSIGISQTSFKLGAGIADGVALNFGFEIKVKKIVLLEEITSNFSPNNITYNKPTFFQTKLGYHLLTNFTFFTGYSYSMISNDQKKINSSFINYGCQYVFKRDNIFIKTEKINIPSSTKNISIIIGKKIIL
jgi:hypothetical protein